jgi:hypothetical protein
MLSAVDILSILFCLCVFISSPFQCSTINGILAVTRQFNKCICYYSHSKQQTYNSIRFSQYSNNRTFHVTCVSVGGD